jgi:hypothetical protein
MEYGYEQRDGTESEAECRAISLDEGGAVDGSCGDACKNRKQRRFQAAGCILREFFLCKNVTPQEEIPSKQEQDVSVPRRAK